MNIELLFCDIIMLFFLDSVMKLKPVNYTHKSVYKNKGKSFYAKFEKGT